MVVILPDKTVTLLKKNETRKNDRQNVCFFSTWGYRTSRPTNQNKNIAFSGQKIE
jgi:hypothetical protein